MQINFGDRELWRPSFGSLPLSFACLGDKRFAEWVGAHSQYPLEQKTPSSAKESQTAVDLISGVEI
jgi:hypothetical protein